MRREISLLETRLSDARVRSRSLSGRLRETELELQLQESRVREARLGFELSSRRIDQSERAVDDLETRLSGLRISLRTHVLALHGLGRQRLLRLLLALRPRGDVVAGVRQLRYLARRDGMAVEKFETMERRVERQRAALGVEEARLRSWLQQEEERRAAVALVRSRHQRLAREASSVRRRLESRAAVLVEREARLGRMIELVAREDSATLDSAPIQDFKGVLDWPLEGEVVTDFGPRLDPRYRTRVPHNGIAIAAASKRPVIPVYPGTVLFAAPFQGYGLTVVIQHAGDVLTLYAGVDSLGVAMGDVVSLNDVLGAASHEIYFELREKNRAVDPLDWLR